MRALPSPVPTQWRAAGPPYFSPLCCVTHLSSSPALLTTHSLWTTPLHCPNPLKTPFSWFTVNRVRVAFTPLSTGSVTYPNLLESPKSPDPSRLFPLLSPSQRRPNTTIHTQAHATIVWCDLGSAGLLCLLSSQTNQLQIHTSSYNNPHFHELITNKHIETQIPARMILLL